MLQTSAVDLSVRSHFNKKKKARKKYGTPKANYKQCIKVFYEDTSLPNFPFKTGLDEIKQLSKEILLFTKVFANRFIFKNNRM